jgi:hypothetical protein
LSHQERRRAERFTFGMPLIVHWKNGSEQRTAHTITEDVSSRGVYFYLPEAIPTGTPVEVEMTMPTQITLGSPVRVRCHGRVQRCVVKPGESAGMATMIEKYEFLCESKDAA